MISYLLDTGFLYALLNAAEHKHEAVLNVARTIHRAAEVIRQYADAHIDFVDALIVALAERLSITRILTLDHRHFRLFRPRHCVAFELLP